MANIYLHYVLDLWANQWRKHHAIGNVTIVLYAADIVVGFEKSADAKRFQRAMQARMRQFGLSLHPTITRLIGFGRFAEQDRIKRGLGKPQSFNFLGFTHLCGKSTDGKFMLLRKTRRDRLQAALKEIKESLRIRWHHSIAEQGRWLRQIVQGYFNYHAVPTNIRSLNSFFYHAIHLWRRALKRRSLRDRITWSQMKRLCEAPRSPYPSSLASCTVCRQTPKAGARCVNCARRDLCGGAQQWAFLPRLNVHSPRLLISA